MAEQYSQPARHAAVPGAVHSTSQAAERRQRLAQSPYVSSEKLHGALTPLKNVVAGVTGVSKATLAAMSATAVTRRRSSSPSSTPICDESSSSRCRQPSLERSETKSSVASEPWFPLDQVPYLVAAKFLDAKTLQQLESSCKHTMKSMGGLSPWRALGEAAFRGIELDGVGAFDAMNAHAGKEADNVNHWKLRYLHFLKDIPTFRAPFDGCEIKTVSDADEVAYCRCMLRAAAVANVGVFIHIDVIANPDNLSLAVVDFEAGGHSSVTFSPDTGAVIRERKVRDTPRKVEGAYIQPLPATIPGRRFEGSVGVYLEAGHLAFLRKTVGSEGQPDTQWESTGFVTDLSWAQGRCLTPCVAFRDEGQYHVKIVCVGSAPPICLGKTPQAYDEARWTSLDWEAGDSDVEDEDDEDDGAVRDGAVTPLPEDM